LSRELIPYVKSIVGVDISQRMVDEYNRRSINQGIYPEEMRAIQADILVHLTSSELQEMKETFDVVVVSQIQ
jgi:23S rRNA G2069 N7-methylase RlmK/C1962 C5-methylase RlmI